MKEDVAGLVERLDQEFGRARRTYSFPIKPADFIDLIVAIRALVAENERLKFGDKQMQGLWAIDREDLAKAEAKLREAAGVLAVLVDRNASISDDTIQLHSMGSHGAAIAVLNRARAFLATTEKQDDE